MSARLAELSSADAVDRAALLGLAASIVGEAATRAEPVFVEPLGNVDARPVAGAVAVNLAALWAGPLAADVLARLGARVIKLESTSRPDGSRAHPAFFGTLAENQEFVAVDFRTEEGRSRLRSLLTVADVVIEGSRPRALEQLGIDARTIAATGPQLWLSITAHGRELPFAMRIGYGDDTSAAGGLVGVRHGAPVFLADAVADPLSGLTAAAAVVDLLPHGGRWLVDVALSRVAASVAEPNAEASTTLKPMRPHVRRVHRHVPELGRDTERVLADFNCG